MEITKEVLNNLKLKRGKLSEKRCQEINQMKIKNPYYPMAYFSQEDCEYFEPEKEDEIVFSEDERIILVDAFYPMPILIRESDVQYDDIYVLIIDNQWYELIFDYLGGKEKKINDIRLYNYSFNLRNNIKIEEDKFSKFFIYLIEELLKNTYIYSDNKKIKKEINLIYKGEEYPWRNWKEL
ncbi:MAG: hypothetical protein IIY49_04010 [Eubacterium sp.]|nr:hypothetical protein [Eubacterium sp.]